MSQTLSNQLDKGKVILPAVSRNGTFTVIAKDNIDLNASSTTRSSHYNGTCLSMLLFPTEENPGTPITYDYD